MDEKRAWLKSGKKTRLRIFSAGLCLSLLVTGFGRLSDEVREQTVPVGTDRSELALPDTLEAYVAVDTGDGAEDDAKPDDGERDQDEDPDVGRQLYLSIHTGGGL